MTAAPAQPPTRPHRVSTRGLLGASALLLVSWVAVLGMVLTNEGVAEDDGPVLRWVVGHRSGGWTRLMETVSSATLTTSVMVGTLVVLALVGVRRRSWQPTITIGGTLAIAAVTSVSIKVLVGRHRPATATMLGAPETGWGFPSGHTLLTSALVGAAALVLWRTTLPRLARVAGVLIAVGAAGLMGASRLYLGVHWFTDVLASYALAGTILLGVAAATRPGRRRDRWTAAARVASRP